MLFVQVLGAEYIVHDLLVRIAMDSEKIQIFLNSIFVDCGELLMLPW